MVFQAYYAKPARRALRGFGEDVPTYLDPASAELPIFSVPDATTSTDTGAVTAPAGEPSLWDTITAEAGSLLKTGVQAGAQVASAALMKSYVAAKGPAPAGYTYDTKGTLVKIPGAAKAGTVFGGLSPLLLVGGAVAVGAFFFLRRK